MSQSKGSPENTSIASAALEYFINAGVNTLCISLSSGHYLY